MKRKWFPFLLSLLILLVFLVLRKNELYNLIQRKIIPPEITKYKQETLEKYYRYQAINVFDKGYNRILGSELKSGLSIFPEDEILESNFISLFPESSEKIVKFYLPDGFKDGILRIDSNSELSFSIGISYDLKNWSFFEYPGCSEKLINILYIEHTNQFNSGIYLKFLLRENKIVDLYFQEFQYVSDLLNEAVGQIEGVLFFHDIDVDYYGQIINQQRIIYKPYEPKENLSK